jgi:flagellar biosynthetic protein FliO
MIVAILDWVDGSSQAPATETWSGPDLTRYLLVCGLLLALVIALGWIARRVLAGQIRSRAARRSLQVLDVLPLGGKQRLMVVRCYDRSFLVGAGEKELCSLAELDPEAAGLAPLVPLAAAPAPPAREREGTRFARVLARTTHSALVPRPRRTHADAADAALGESGRSETGLPDGGLLG